MKRKEETPEELYNRFFTSPLMSRIQARYPNRDYELDFLLMVDWWIEEKGRLPRTIAAFANWLAHSKPDDPTGMSENSLTEPFSAPPLETLPPIKPETLSKLRNMKNDFIKKHTV